MRQVQQQIVFEDCRTTDNSSATVGRACIESHQGERPDPLARVSRTGSFAPNLLLDWFILLARGRGFLASRSPEYPGKSPPDQFDGHDGGSDQAKNYSPDGPSSCVTG